MNEQQIHGLRPVNSLDEPGFGKLINKVLSPSAPLESPEFLKGRDAQLTSIRQALYAEGRHVFIHGFRGVGKTSLARTAALQHQTSQNHPIFLACTEKITFAQVMRDMLAQAIRENPLVVKKINECAVSGSPFGLGAKINESIETGEISLPDSINKAISFAELLVKVHSDYPVVVIDEFDLLTNQDEQESFANFIKQVSDRRIPIKFIFCGIGDSIDKLMKAHRSAHRYFHTVKLDRLSWEARSEIIDTAAQKLGIEIDQTTHLRICKISDGFPHYVHLLTEKLFWQVYSARNNGKVTPDLFKSAMEDASRDMEPELKVDYEIATKKYTNEYEDILFAVADSHELSRRSSDIYESYIRIMLDQNKQPLDRSKFNNRMANLKRPACANILTASRQGWYEYTEKVVRGYARLRAEQKGIDLEVDHPAIATKYKTKRAIA